MVCKFIWLHCSWCKCHMATIQSLTVLQRSAFLLSFPWYRCANYNILVEYHLNGCLGHTLLSYKGFQWNDYSLNKRINSIGHILSIWDDFNFPIVNFPFLSSNIPSAPAYGIYVSQLIRYARTCSNYQDFMERGKVLTQKLLSQGYQKTKLVATLKKFYGRHHDLVNPYNVAVSRIVSDVFASDAP